MYIHLSRAAQLLFLTNPHFYGQTIQNTAGTGTPFHSQHTAVTVSTIWRALIFIMIHGAFFLFLLLTSLLLDYSFASIDYLDYPNPNKCSKTNKAGNKCNIAVSDLFPEYFSIFNLSHQNVAYAPSYQVEISCEIMNGRQAGRSCLNYETETMVEPAIHTFWDEQCSTITGKISFHLCNLDKSDAIKLHRRRTKLRYDGDEIPIPVESRRIGPKQCKVISIEREWDTCDINPEKGSRSRPMSAQLSTRNVRTRNVSNGGYNAHCYCKFALKRESFPMHVSGLQRSSNY